MVVTPSARSRTTEFRHRVQELLEYAMALSSADASAVGAAWDTIVEFFCDLVARGRWTRKEIYELVGAAIEAASSRLPARSIDLLMDYESGMCGDCAPSSIPRLPGDPADQAEFERYVHSGEWLV